MQLECDFALLGTGLAPLLAAQALGRQGGSVLLLNPDHDFFRENSELPLEPILLGETIHPTTIDRIRPQRLESAREILSPEFPGSLEFWLSEASGSRPGFRDSLAPFVRSRQWNWITLSHEDLFLSLLEAGLNPRSFQGLSSARRFPGYNWQRGLDPAIHSVVADRFVDVDLDRYRQGVLEFVRSRISPERMLTSISGLELGESGLRFFHRGGVGQAKVKKALWVFWTPRVSSWLEKFCSTVKPEYRLPVAPLVVWEEWSLRSRDPIDPTQVGITSDAVAYARSYGEPREPMLELDVLMHSTAGGQLVGAESFQRLGRFVQNFLNWDRFRVRDLKTRVLLGVPEAEWMIPGASVPVRVMSGCEGGLVGVVKRVLDFSIRGGIDADPGA